MPGRAYYQTPLIPHGLPLTLTTLPILAEQARRHRGEPGERLALALEEGRRLTREERLLALDVMPYAAEAAGNDAKTCSALGDLRDVLADEVRRGV